MYVPREEQTVTKTGQVATCHLNTLKMFDIKYTVNDIVGCCVFEIISRGEYTFMFIGR